MEEPGLFDDVGGVSDIVDVLAANKLEQAQKGVSPYPDAREIYADPTTPADHPREVDEAMVRRIVAVYAMGVNKPAFRTREQAAGAVTTTTYIVPLVEALKLLGRDENRKSVTVWNSSESAAGELVLVGTGENIKNELGFGNVGLNPGDPAAVFTNPEPLTAVRPAGAAGVLYLSMIVERYE